MQLKFVLFLFIVLSLPGAASTLLRPGDILLQPLNCWACNLIEAEENSIYSHMGIVLQVRPEILVAESFGNVRLVNLKKFLSKTEKGQVIKVLRLRNGLQRKVEFISIFMEKFNGLSYDPSFDWDNTDIKGSEQLYCSEFVSKFLKVAVGYDAPLKSMHFIRYRNYWTQYFNGDIPDGGIGNSPADFDKSDEFIEIDY